MKTWEVYFLQDPSVTVGRALTLLRYWLIFKDIYQLVGIVVVET